MADGSREGILSARHQAVSRVLTRVLVLNLAVALAKLILGYATGAVSIVSDGFHSLTDSASNIIGLVGLRAADKPPDADHPYGHRKYETVAAGALTYVTGGTAARGGTGNVEPVSAATS